MVNALIGMRSFQGKMSFFMILHFIYFPENLGLTGLNLSLLLICFLMEPFETKDHTFEMNRHRNTFRDA